MKKLFVVISYDISDDKRLRRVAKELLRWGKRVQKSVFEASLKESDFLKLKKRLKKLIKSDEDSVRFYFLCKSCRENIEFMGKTPPPEYSTDDFEVI